MENNVIPPLHLCNHVEEQTDFFGHCTVSFGLFSVKSIHSNLMRLYWKKKIFQFIFLSILASNVCACAFLVV